MMKLERVPQDELNRRARVMRLWSRRQRDLYKFYSADGLKERIKYNWPTMSAEDIERIYEGACK